MSAQNAVRLPKPNFISKTKLFKIVYMDLNLQYETKNMQIPEIIIQLSVIVRMNSTLSILCELISFIHVRDVRKE